MKQIHYSKLVLVLFIHFVTCLTKYPSPERDVIWLTSVWIYSPLHELFCISTIVLNTGNEAVMSGLSVSMVYLGDRNNLEAYGSDALKVRKGGLRCKWWRSEKCSGKVTRIRGSEGCWPSREYRIPGTGTVPCIVTKTCYLVKEAERDPSSPGLEE